MWPCKQGIVGFGIGLAAMVSLREFYELKMMQNEPINDLIQTPVCTGQFSLVFDKYLKFYQNKDATSCSYIHWIYDLLIGWSSVLLYLLSF